MPYSDGDSESAASPLSGNNHYDQCETIDVERMDEEDDCSSNDSRQRHSSDGMAVSTKSDDRAGSRGSSSSSSLMNRNPTCALCKNHRLSSPLKGHKRYCQFKHCGCDLCRVTRKKQKINASQVANRRAIQQDRELGIVSTSVSASSTPKAVHSPVPSQTKPADPVFERPPRPTVIASRDTVLQAQHVQPAPPQFHQPFGKVANSGPALYAENMSLECFLLNRNSSLLMNTLRDSRLSVEQLAYLDRDISAAIRVIKEEVVGHLNDIEKYLIDRIQREKLNSSSSAIGGIPKYGQPTYFNPYGFVSDMNAKMPSIDPATTYPHLYSHPPRDAYNSPSRLDPSHAGLYSYGPNPQ